MRYRELIQILTADGWYEDSHTGGHKMFKHPSKQNKVPVKIHSGELDPKYVKMVLAEAGLRGINSLKDLKGRKS
jgi:predicted RNA binding protein YcfA (HicA-like mRNA interferase family)